MCWPACYEDEVIEMIWMYKDMFFPEPTDIDIPQNEAQFKRRCDELWAVDDLVEYIKNNLGENAPFEIIGDYIDDCRYRAEKYKETIMGQPYAIALQTAKNIMDYFVCEV